MKRFSAKVLLIAALLLLGACSSTTFIYNRLDFLLPWYLGDYVELSRTQKSELDDLLQPFLGWHRSEELPIYLETLNQFDASLDGTVATQDIVDFGLALEAAWTRMENEGIKWMLALGANLSDQQLAQFLHELQEKQEEYEAEYLTRTDEEYREDTYDSMLDNFQDYLGKLDLTQKEILRASSAAMQRSDSAWLEERADWLVKLGRLLEREPGWQQRVRDELAAREERRSPEYQQVFEHNVNQIQETMVAILNSRSEKQNRRLRKKIDNLREDLQTLIEQGANDQANGAGP
jgi:hypothetical protein